MFRVQLVLRVSDLEGSVVVYTELFGVEPAERWPGYANFAIDEPPLTLVLLEGEPDQPTVMDHLGVEAFSTGEGVLARILGPVDVTVNGIPRPVRGVRRKAVLAALALQPGEIVSTGRLIDVVWGERAPTTAANTLQSHLSHLRGVLGSRTAIRAHPPGYVLEIGTDLQQAQRLIHKGQQSADPATSAAQFRAALDLWRDRPLVDVAGLSWWDDQAERLAKIELEAAMGLIEARLALGEHTQLVPELERLSRQHPFHEHIHGQFILALYRSGRETDALATYQKLRHTLREELGVDPSPALRELEAAILRQDTVLAPPAPTITLRPPDQTAPTNRSA